MHGVLTPYVVVAPRRIFIGMKVIKENLLNIIFIFLIVAVVAGCLSGVVRGLW